MTRTLKSRGMKWAGHAVRMGDKKKAYMLLVGMPQRKRLLGRSRRRRVNDNKMAIRMGCYELY
jgi:hypothetical protein